MVVRVPVVVVVGEHDCAKFRDNFGRLKVVHHQKMPVVPRAPRTHPLPVDLHRRGYAPLIGICDVAKTHCRSAHAWREE